MVNLQVSDDIIEKEIEVNFGETIKVSILMKFPYKDKEFVVAIENKAPFDIMFFEAIETSEIFEIKSIEEEEQEVVECFSNIYFPMLIDNQIDELEEEENIIIEVTDKKGKTFKVRAIVFFEVGDKNLKRDYVATITTQANKEGLHQILLYRYSKTGEEKKLGIILEEIRSDMEFESVKKKFMANYMRKYL